jgi:ATP phosphoribosyltransferase regulatory subunit
MAQWKLPENLEDFLPVQAKKLESYRRQLLDLFEKLGYKFIIPSLLEYEDSLNAHGKDLNLDTFKVVDQMSGRMMGVSSDLTTQVSRIDAYLSEGKGENKLCYAGPIIRTKAAMGQSRELYQVGLEYYGNPNVEADTEIVNTLIESLKLLNIKDIIIDINHLAVYRSIIKEVDLDINQKDLLAEAVTLKDKTQISHILQTTKNKKIIDLLSNLVELYGDQDVFKLIKEQFSKDKELKKCFDDVQKVVDVVEKEGAKVNFDFSDIRGYQYHTGIMFAAYASGFKSALAQGGRYDNLNSSLGSMRPATGFSMDLKYIVNHQ